MRGKIGNRLLAVLQPREKPFEIADSEIAGFLIRVSPHGSRHYFVRYRLPNGQQTRMKLGSAAVLTPTQAREMAKQALAEVARGEDPAAGRKHSRGHSLRSFLEEVYLPWVHVNRKSGKMMVQALLAGFPELLDKKLADINVWLVEKWRHKRLEEGLKPATTNRLIAYLKSALSRAVEWNLLDETPLRRVKSLREDNSRVRFLDPDERQRLLQALDRRDEQLKEERDNHNAWRRERGYPETPDLRGNAFADYLKPMVLLSLNTGLRRGELFSLEWSDINLDGKRLTVRAAATKGGKTRHIPLNQTALDVLRRWHAQSDGEGLVFRNPRTDGRFTHIYTAWENLLNEAEINNFHWHDMRHDFASNLVMAGVDLYVVKELLGHSSITMTERYSHLAPAVMAAAVAKLDMKGAGAAEKPSRKAAKR
ncbi:MAG: site-specific integrase [Candidatus Hydrogenedentes bacterium]|nr:site-specific integrase [Candidatus Hydrogenedentota bacterium]